MGSVTQDSAQGAIEEIESDVTVDGIETRRRGFALAPAYFLVLAGAAVLVLALVVGWRLTATGSAAESYTFFNLTPNTTYYLRVFSAASGTGQGAFSVCVTTPAP